MARNWLKTLWRCSFKGAPFWVDGDEESGGRRIVEHIFPMSDIPYLEDLGEDLRKFEVTAYLASDTVDVEALLLTAAMTSRGPGMLVLPLHGPVYVRNVAFKRSRAKDRHGYVGYTLSFTREGASSALVSVNYLSSLIFGSAEALAVAAAASFVSSFVVSGIGGLRPQPVDFVLQSAVGGLQTSVSMMEAIRSTNVVEQKVNSAQRVAIQTAYSSIPGWLESEETVALAPTSVLSIASAISDGMDPRSAVTAFEAVIVEPSLQIEIAATYATPNRRAADLNVAAAYRVCRMAAIAAYASAIGRLSITDRQTGITLRANVAEYFESEIIDLPASEAPLIRAIEALGDRVVDYLSRSIIDLSAVVTVETNLSMPSLAMAWSLYQDPNRAPEIVARNRVVHPSFLPTSFEALGPPDISKTQG